MAQTITIKMDKDSEYYFVDASASNQGATDATYDSAKDLIDAIGATKNATLVFAHSGGGNTTTYSFGTSETIPQNIEVVIENGAILAIATGVTLTIDGSFQNGRNSCITLAGTGTVIFDKRFVNYLYPEWWGAIGDDSTNSTTAIQATINCAEAMGGCIVDFAATNYRFTSLTMDDPGVLLQGKGIDATVLKTTSATGNIITIGDTGANYNASGGIRDLSLYTTTARTAGYMIYIDGCEQGIINNIKIGENEGIAVGGGIYFGSNLSALWFVTDSVIEIQGAFYGIRLSGSNDQYFNNLWIRGDGVTDNSAGIYIDKNGGAWFTDIDVVEFYYGLQISAGDGQIVSWLNFKNLLVDQNELYGVYIDSTHANGSVLGITFDSLWSSTNGAAAAAARGVYIKETAGAVNGISFSTPRIIDNGGHGIQVDAGPIFVSIIGGMIGGNSAQAANTYNGIYMNGADNWLISGVMSGAVAGTTSSQQKYGIEIVLGCIEFLCTSNLCYGNGTGGILDSSGVINKQIGVNEPDAV